MMAKIVEDAILIYTDGSLYPKGRRGGYGIVFVHVDDIGNETIIKTHAPPGIRGTTSPRMELQACVEALKIVPKLDCFHTVGQVVLRTDSLYVKDHWRYALDRWPKRKWSDRHGRPLENVDLWKDFARAYRNLHKRFDVEWVKAHGKGRARDPYNVAADKLAKDSAKNPLSRREFLSSVRPKTSTKYTQRRSVKMFGQTMVVYIIEVKWMGAPHKEWKYRYQVASKDNPDYDNIDWIYSNEQMRDRHYYEVQVNDNMDYPKVLEVIREVDVKEVAN